MSELIVFKLYNYKLAKFFSFYNLYFDICNVYVIVAIYIVELKQKLLKLLKCILIKIQIVKPLNYY